MTQHGALMEPEGRQDRRLGRRFHLRASFAAVAAALAVYVWYRVAVAPKSVDLAVYRATGAAARAGRPIYGDLHLFDHLVATYPPFAAVIFVPLSFLSLGVLQYIVLAANLVLLASLTERTAHLLGIARGERTRIILLAVSAGLIVEPVVATLNLGQIDLALAWLVVADFSLRAGSPWKGVGIGLATAIKLTPGLFVVYLVLTRRYRQAATATVTFVLVSGGSWMFLPDASRKYWTQLIFDARRVGLVGRPDNQSLRGLLARFANAPDVGTAGTVAAVVVALFGLAIARAAYYRLGEVWGLLACAFTGLLVAPISWTHHWVWCVPAALVLWSQARRWLPAVVVFWTYVVLLPVNRRTRLVHYSELVTIVSGAYVYAAIAVLVLVAARATRAPKAAAV